MRAPVTHFGITAGLARRGGPGMRGGCHGAPGP